MALRHLLVAALAASAAWAADDCQCVNKDQTIDPIKNPMIFFQQPTKGGLPNADPCSASCTFTASLDANADNYALQINLLTNQLKDGKLTVSGMNDSIVITSNTATGLLFGRSYGDKITIDFTEPSTTIGTFMLVVQKVEGRPSAPVTKIPPTVAPTEAYDEKFKANPRLVANDIMLVFDMSSEYLETFKSFATSLINELSIKPKSLETDDEECDAGSRLSVVGLSSLAFDNLYAPYWSTTAEQAVGNIGSMARIGSGAYLIKEVKGKYIAGFADNDDVSKCRNRGKIFIMLSSKSPSDGMNQLVIKPEADIPFLANGVHQILVNYNMMSNETVYYDAYTTDNDDTQRWNSFALTGTDNDVVKFINTFLVESDYDMTCQQPKDYTLEVGGMKDETPAEAKKVKLSIPPYYKGVTEDNKPRAAWDVPQHYCNFQQTTVQLVKDEGVSDSTKVCLKVFYDLETGKDFVSIYSGEEAKGTLEEVVRLTGRDVSGTTFELPGPVGKIVFTSDEKNVYDGFYAEITKCT